MNFRISSSSGRASIPAGERCSSHGLKIVVTPDGFGIAEYGSWAPACRGRRLERNSGGRDEGIDGWQSSAIPCGPCNQRRPLAGLRADLLESNTTEEPSFNDLD